MPTKQNIPLTEFSGENLRRFKTIHIVGGLLIFSIIVALGALMAHYHVRQQLAQTEKTLTQTQKQLAQYQSDPNAKASAENRQLIDKVGQLVVLPTDEQPTIASVTDPAKLSDQPFFAHAQVGDKVLIYANAKKAILYRPGENKIIELAPVNLGAQSATTGTGGGTDASTNKASKKNTSSSSN